MPRTTFEQKQARFSELISRPRNRVSPDCLILELNLLLKASLSLGASSQREVIRYITNSVLPIPEGYTYRFGCYCQDQSCPRWHRNRCRCDDVYYTCCKGIKGVLIRPRPRPQPQATSTRDDAPLLTWDDISRGVRVPGIIVPTGGIRYTLPPEEESQEDRDTVVDLEGEE